MVFNYNNKTMSIRVSKLLLVSLAALVALLASDPAFAFRCGNKIVRDGMHELRVVAICGQPTAQRNLGYTTRGYDTGWRQNSPGSIRRHYYPGHAQLREEVVITEYVYNFGPRKLMRRLVFEGGVLKTIETIGYGYIEQKP